MRLTLERLLSVAIAASSVTVAAVYLKQHVDPGSRKIAASTLEKPVYIEGWEGDTASGFRVGSYKAPVTIVEFMDLECPFCRKLAAVTDSLRAEYPEQIAVVIQHFPLPNHRFAALAAVGTECAGEQARFFEFYSLVFRKQDSLGLKQWSSYAAEAGIPDVDGFVKCHQTNVTFPRIESGRNLGKRIGIVGTPTVLVNGWRLPRTPGLNELRNSVRAALIGRPPGE